MPTFQPNRQLLNPHFDGYKFQPLEDDVVASHCPLTHRISQTNVSGRAALSFEEVRSRVLHNHLTVCAGNGHGNAPGPARAAYVDEELRVIGIDVDEATLRPAFRVLCELPRPIHSDGVETFQREYPSAAFLDGETLFVADGYGSLYALHGGHPGSGAQLAYIEVATPSLSSSPQRTAPFRVHHVASPTDGCVVAILSAKHYPQDTTTTAKTAKSPSVKFDIWGIQVSLPLSEQTSSQVVWHRRGQDVPFYTAYDTSRTSFLLVGGAPYLPITVAPTPTYEPSADELAQIPREGENVDGQSSGTMSAVPSVPKPPPYSWTQTSDSLTIAIPLPSDTPTARIRIAFAPRTLTVLVDGAPDAPRFTLKSLWDGVRTGTSMWTFDRAAERRYGMLTLHLDKLHEGTRWPQVFAQNGTNDDEVPETLDPSELYAIREALEKYTAALEEGGLGHGMPSLAEGERDDELDTDVGNTACVTFVGALGAPDPGRADDTPLQVLSTPFPGTGGISLVAKHGVDGVAFVLEAAASSPDPTAHPTWAHGWTYSALAFVLASKRDTRFVHHAGAQAVFAFESGGGGEGAVGGNVYVYRGSGPKENWAKQTVLKIGGGEAGALLGVGAMGMQEGRKTVVLCLCEGELVVLHGVL